MKRFNSFSSTRRIRSQWEEIFRILRSVYDFSFQSFSLLPVPKLSLPLSLATYPSEKQFSVSSFLPSLRRRVCGTRKGESFRKEAALTYKARGLVPLLRTLRTEGDPVDGVHKGDAPDRFLCFLMLKPAREQPTARRWGLRI